MKKFIFVAKVLFLILLFWWLVVIFTDYFRVRTNKDPMFCLTEKTIDYTDGSTYICDGFGYRAIRYNRSCMTAAEFGPSFIKERNCN